jgi:uncharacterized protein
MIDSRTMPNRRVEYIRGFGILITIAVVGLFIAKWQPYFQRTFTILGTHAYPGSSILTGKEVAPPTPSIQAALAYGQTYFLSIWQALVVGLLLAATLETLVPKDWVLRVLRSSHFRSSFLGGVLALPGMM